MYFILNKFDRKKLLYGEKEQKWWKTMIDLFLCIRIIIAACFSLEKNYSLYYLCGKNVLLCMLEVYRVVVLMYEQAKKELKEIKEEEQEKKENPMDSATQQTD
jgi:hypothetical protein